MNKFILGLVFALFSCQTNCNGVESVKNQDIPPEYAAIINQISTEIEEKFTKRYNVERVPGDYRMVDWANKPRLEFQIVGPLTKNELRVMLINGIEEFLNIINFNEKLRPFLKKYPFTANEIAMGILVIDKNKRMVYDPHIGTAGLDRGRICFNIIDNNEYEYKLTEMEDYETALKIVKGSKN